MHCLCRRVRGTCTYLCSLLCNSTTLQWLLPPACLYSHAPCIAVTASLLLLRTEAAGWAGHRCEVACCPCGVVGAAAWLV